MERICCIVGAGELYDNKIPLSNVGLLIAADGGYKYLKEFNIDPDILIGDFDSLAYMPDVKNIIKLNKIKDETDMIVSVNEGLKQGYKKFHIYGGTGGRLDHTLANIQYIAHLSKIRCEAYLFGNNEVITAITDTSIIFDCNRKGIISVFAHDSVVRGVTENGLKYPLEDAVLSNAYPLGVSNEFTGKESSVTVKEGTIIIIYPQ